MERAQIYALLFAFAFLITGLYLATTGSCEIVASLQVCTLIYQSTGDVLVAFGGLFLALWVVLVALEDMRPH